MRFGEVDVGERRSAQERHLERPDRVHRRLEAPGHRSANGLAAEHRRGRPGDLGGHGGENRAVLVYQLDSYRRWGEQFGRDDLVPGMLGENLTVEGLPDEPVVVDL
jgi:MOSC domain-containing protein YiiM